MAPDAETADKLNMLFTKFVESARLPADIKLAAASPARYLREEDIEAMISSRATDDAAALRKSITARLTSSEAGDPATRTGFRSGQR